MTAELASTGSFLFVYGTLRPGSGHPMADYLAQHARLLGQARVAGRLYDLGPYPGMVESEGADDWVRGEVFELHKPGETLAELDRYEDSVHQPPLFERRLGQVELADGRTLPAWIYCSCGDLTAAKRIASGDYLLHPREAC